MKRASLWWVCPLSRGAPHPFGKAHAALSFLFGRTRGNVRRGRSSPHLGMWKLLGGPHSAPRAGLRSSSRGRSGRAARSGRLRRFGPRRPCPFVREILRSRNASSSAPASPPEMPATTSRTPWPAGSTTRTARPARTPAAIASRQARSAAVSAAIAARRSAGSRSGRAHRKQDRLLTGATPTARPPARVIPTRTERPTAAASPRTAPRAATR